MFKIPGSRKGYYQWDINQRLYITDSGCNEVHFCSEKHPAALTCQVQEESNKRYVQVPNILLQSCLPITVFCYMRGNDHAYTKLSDCIEVWERPKPEDYVYTETEVKTWESAVEYALQEAKESGAFKGERGEKGDKGDTGEQGPQGEKGEKGDGFLTDEDRLSLSIRCDGEGAVVDLKDASALPFVGLKIFGKTTQDGTPTPDTPAELVSAGDGGSIGVTVCGGNLFNPYGLSNVSFYTVDEDGYINFANNTAYYHHPSINIPLPKGDYTVSVDIAEIGGNAAVYFSSISQDYTQTIKTSTTKTFTDAELVWIEIAGKDGATCKVRITVNEGAVAIPYEPYRGQTLTASTPNGLPGIPVSSGGNYIDANGQRWLAHIAGYVQDGQVGELVTTGHIESYAGETITGAYLSSTGGLDVGASVRYALEVPEFVPYDADVQVQWKALHTNKPNTTIYNDAGAGMKVSYAADPKTYIDNKFAKLAAAIVNNT